MIVFKTIGYILILGVVVNVLALAYSIYRLGLAINNTTEEDDSMNNSNGLFSILSPKVKSHHRLESLKEEYKALISHFGDRVITDHVMIIDEETVIQIAIVKDSTFSELAHVIPGVYIDDEIYDTRMDIMKFEKTGQHSVYGLDTYSNMFEDEDDVKDNELILVINSLDTEDFLMSSKYEDVIIVQWPEIFAS